MYSPKGHEQCRKYICSALAALLCGRWCKPSDLSRTPLSCLQTHNRSSCFLVLFLPLFIPHDHQTPRQRNAHTRQCRDRDPGHVRPKHALPQQPHGAEVPLRPVRDTAAAARDEDPRRELRARVLEVQQRRREGGEGFDFLERDAQRDEAETRARPGEEGSF